MNDSYDKNLTSTRIQRQLHRLPPLQRDAFTAQRYLGKRIAWRTRFFDALDIGQDPVRHFSFLQRGWRRFAYLDHPIYAPIDLSQHPDMRDMRRGRRVDLFGTIVAVDALTGITLALDRFALLPVTPIDWLVQEAESRR